MTEQSYFIRFDDNDLLEPEIERIDTEEAQVASKILGRNSLAMKIHVESEYQEAPKVLLHEIFYTLENTRLCLGWSREIEDEITKLLIDTIKVFWRDNGLD